MKLLAPHPTGGYDEIDNDDGETIYRRAGLLHREDGPAVEGAIREWYRHGVVHREDGPALEYADGSTEWLLHGIHHRIGGPAVIDHDDTSGATIVMFFVQGTEITKTVHDEVAAAVQAGAPVEWALAYAKGRQE